MKKIYIAIVCIALALFISCDEKKAKDEIKKALDKTVEEKDKAKQKLTKPAINSQRARVGTAVTFPKVEGYTYELKDPTISGVMLNVSDKNTGEVRATEAASGIIIVATKDGTSIESNPIEFVDITLTKPVVSSYRVRVGQVATFPKVLGHTYELKEEKTGVTLSEGTSNTMQVRATQAASNVIIVATLDGKTLESNPIKFIELTKPAINSQRAKVGTAVTFPKVEGHTYELKDPTISGVSLELSSERMGEVRATEASSNVIVVATLNGSSEDSDPIEFVEIIKPAFSQPSAPWNAPPIIFPKVAGYTYELKQEKTGVTLSEANSETMQVTATQYAQNVIIVVTDNGLNEDSDPIEFTRIPGNTLSFAQARRTQKWTPSTVTFTQTATKNRTVAGDTRDIRYSVRCRGKFTPTIDGVSVNENTGEVTIRGALTLAGTCTFTAELPQTAKYERSTATYTLVIN